MIRRVVAGAALVGLFGLGQISLPQAMSRTWAQPPAADAQVTVIVQATPGALAQAQIGATALGGQVTRELRVITGFAARVPATALPRLRALPGVVSVTVDGTAKPMSATTLAGLSPNSTETGTLSAIEQIIGVPGAWAAGWTGKGVDVAVIDTGVTRVTGLAGDGQVLDGPDLSLDSQNPDLARMDSYGHGTFMAGLIAGRDPGTTNDLKSLTDPTQYVGVAPDARIVNVKVGATDGAADVSQVIAGIDWVVAHAHDPGLNIRVLNLSYGSTAQQAYTVDPLAQAAEQAWKHGIVVVAAAGNDGKQVLELANPAYDPYLLAVGADDPRTTLAATDDKVATFAQHGTTTRPVDVITPGVHVIGLRVPGSYIDTLPSNLGRVGDRFQRGSGTSQSAAITSGLAALAIQAHPEATPDQIKALIKTSAVPLPRCKKTTDATLAASGNGIPQADTATQTALTALPPAGSTVQTWTPSTGTGTLDAARGGVYIASGGVALTGQRDIFGQPYNSAAMADQRATGQTWNGGTWNASRWAGDTWTGNDWTGSGWAASRWAGMTWTGSRWAGTGWTASRWADSSWTASRWASATLD